MKPDDAERVVLASTQGSIHFVLRNSADRIQVKDLPVNLSQLISLDAAAQPAVHRKPILRPKPYVVETVMGSQHTATSFN